jgi:hypothetical protein
MLQQRTGAHISLQFTARFPDPCAGDLGMRVLPLRKTMSAPDCCFAVQPPRSDSPPRPCACGILPSCFMAYEGSSDRSFRVTSVHRTRSADSAHGHVAALTISLHVRRRSWLLALGVPMIYPQHPAARCGRLPPPAQLRSTRVQTRSCRATGGHA